MNKWLTCVHKGLCKHPCTQLFRLQGFAMGHIDGYRCEGPTANPGECLIHARGSMKKPS